MKNTSFLPNIKDNFSDWYNEIISLAKLADYSPVKGCITILPYGYAMWELMQKELDCGIKAMGAMNMAFPLLIPLHLLSKEKEHVAGFAPEIALVTVAGGETLEEPLVIRPTSEVIIHSYFKKWIKSWRDLPIKVNQWCSVIRWEKRPRPFIRTTEFWWQEGHTAHETIEQAKQQVEDAIQLYKKFAEDFLCIPVILGKKPDHERFAGADETWTIEGMMQDGKAVQMGTSHLLSEGFSTSIGIDFQDRGQKISSPSLTSWGVTTRLIGTVIMVHGDQKGLVLPPLIAPIQIAIVPILKSSENPDQINTKIAEIFRFLLKLNFRSKIYDDQSVSPGSRFAKTELQGIPFRIEIGERDLLRGEFTLYNRLNDRKEQIALNFLRDEEAVKDFFSSRIEHFQKKLFQDALFKRDKNIYRFAKFSDFLIESEKNKKNSFFLSRWCCKNEEIFKEHGFTVRCLLSEKASVEIFMRGGVLEEICCIHDNCKENLKIALIAKSY